MVDTACAAIAPGQAKAPTTPTDINTFHCTYGHAHEVLLNETEELQESTSARNSTNTGGVQWRRGYGSPSPGRRTPEQVPSAPPAPSQQLPPIAEGGVYNGGGRERGGGVKSGRREDIRLGQRVRPRLHDGDVAPGATRNARGANGRT